VNADRPSTLILIAWIIALVSTLGSLFFSDIMKLPPCVLCWYQRIFMYPLVAILTVGWLLRDSKIHLYALPLSLSGLAIAIYHNLLYYHLIEESIIPCTQGISCTSRQIEWLGFVTIPLLSLVGFLLINMILIINLRRGSSQL
jgi:disulfide bond formation protein DsbB